MNAHAGGEGPWDVVGVIVAFRRALGEIAQQQCPEVAAEYSTLDDLECPQEYRQLLSAQRRTDCMGAPIRMAGRPVGEFWVARDNGRPFSEADDDLAVACGAMLARFF